MYASYRIFLSWVLCCFGACMLFAQTSKQPSPMAQHNNELNEIFREDQRDRGEDPFDREASQSLKKVPWEEVRARDPQRLNRVRAMLAAGQIQTAQDYAYAAFILQHGSSADDYALAHVLAATAAFKTRPAPRWARWLAAAALDRFLHASGQPQVFGTQVKGQKSAQSVTEWTLEPYNRTAVTNAMRKEWCVISLEEQERMIRRASGGEPLGPTNIRDCR